MRNKLLLIVCFFLFTLSACGPKLSKEAYIDIMSELGCNLVAENSPASEAIYKKYDASAASIMEFRKKTKAEVMISVAQEIAKRVATCHGVK